MAPLTLDGGRKVRVANTFLTTDDPSSAAADRPPLRAGSCPPLRCAKQSDAKLEIVRHPTGTRVAPVELNAKEEQSLNISQPLGAESETPYLTQEEADEDGLVFGNHPQERYEDKKDMKDTKGQTGSMEQERGKKTSRGKIRRKDNNLARHKKERAPENVVIVKNIPSRVVGVEMLMAISSLGFYDVLVDFNMPMRPDPEGRPLNKGFAFVKFAELSTCQQFREAASGYEFKDRISKKVLEAYLVE